MADIPLDKKTISVGILIAAFPAVFYLITTWTRYQAQTDRNTTDIASIVTEMKELNDNLNKTNGNIIELNTKLEGLSRQTSASIEVTPKESKSIVYVQPAKSQASMTASNGQGQALQPQTQSQDKPQEQTPEQPQEQDTSVLADVIGLVGTVTEVAGIRL